MFDPQMSRQEEATFPGSAQSHAIPSQTIRGHKVLATPAVRKLAMENNVCVQGMFHISCK